METVIILILVVLTSVVAATKCGTNEIFCNATTGINCQDGSSTGCYCKEGYDRDFKGNCVPTSTCCSDANEEHLPNGFEYTCEDLNSNKQRLGSPGCFCKKGYVRHEEKCILENNCPSMCHGTNEIYLTAECICGPDFTCDGHIYNQSQPYPKCQCRKDYHRNSKGTCIPKAACPNNCTRPHEIFKETGCDYSCDGQPNGSNRGSGCYCESGYVRNVEGNCILKDSCPPECIRPHEIPMETGCDYTCEDQPYGSNRGRGCYCEPGYVRNIEENCIPQELCPPKCTRPHEIPKETGCDYTCEDQPYGSNRGRGCYCEPGYVRNIEDCIPQESCPPKCTGPHEIPKETGCDYTCDGQPHDSNRGRGCYCEPGYVRNIEGNCILQDACQLNCTRPHEILKETGIDYTCDGQPHGSNQGRGCYCEPGYVRSIEGNCITQDSCSPKCSCINEIYKDTGCDTSCEEEMCTTYPGKRCYCKPGFVRDEGGKCIRRENCPLKCICPNEIHKETGCDSTCDEKACTINQETRCYCKPGFVRNASGKCIRIENCPQKCSFPNEIHKQTGCDFTCDGKACITIHSEGCYCKQGFVRNAMNKCIRRENCPPKCSGANEIHKETGCDSTCDGKACTTNHIKGCYCKPGFVRNVSGKCIRKENCPPKCSCPNEIYKQSGCDSTCDGKVCSTIQREGCYCKQGFVRNANNKCVRRENCQQTCSDPNEIHKEAGCDSTCDGKACTTNYIKGCYCKQGFVRNASGKCIRKENCPPKCSCPNETHKQSGCDSTCDGKVCSTIQREGCYCKQGFVRNTNNKCIRRENCQQMCSCPNEIHKDSGCDSTCGGTVCTTKHVKRCYCKTGFVRNESGKCIRKENCPLKCSCPNEIYKEEGCDSTCEGRVCITNDGKGCYCKPGFVRNVENKCIAIAKCPPKCKGPNEVHKERGFDYTCDGQTCTTENGSSHGSGCYCKLGYVRNIYKICILKSNCPPTSE